MLDIGSGISPIIEINKNSYFFDLSKKSVEFMKSKGANAFVSDIKKTNFDNSFFDQIVCSEVLEHIDDVNLALKELNRILKEEGELIITIPIHKYYWGKDDELVGHIQRFNLNTFKQILEKNKFKIKKIVKIGNPLERILTLLITVIFLKSKKKNNNIKSFIILFKIINIILCYLMLLITKITPMFLVSDVMILSKK